MNKYVMDVKFIFEGKVTVTAENQKHAEELVEDNFGIVAGGNFHTSLPDEEIDWDFNTHPKKEIIGMPKRVR